MIDKLRMMTTQGAVIAVLALTSVAAPASTARAACNTMTFPVTVATLSQASTVAGTLCRKTNGANDRTVVITAHGATYNRSYWDWPQKPQSYSLIRRLLPSVSVLNIDLLGSGRSSHPVSAHLTQDAEASVLHQLVQSMRRLGFRRVILLGHSSGSGAVTLAAARYRNVDGIIVTGFLHHSPGASVPLSMYPATFDPAFSDKGLDVGYLTTRPGSRATNGFYNAAVADPSVIAYDEAHKDVAPSPHMSEFLVIIGDRRISRQVNVPVLSLVGANDGFCGSPACSPAADEPTAWSSAARLELHVIPRAGHDIHLHGSSYTDAEAGYVLHWLTRQFAHRR
jgi:pimeloyl-ACP methyl ester carboxylesterase